MDADAGDEDYDQLPVVPLGDRKLRACLVTGLVKTEDQVRTGERDTATVVVYPHVMPACASEPRTLTENHMSELMAQFYREGNDNVPCLNMAGDRDMVAECTSSNFDG
jgi:hypothetical protein